jgi:hypothetical protein
MGRFLLLSPDIQRHIVLSGDYIRDCFIPMLFQLSKCGRARRPAATSDGGDRRPCRSELCYPFEGALFHASASWPGECISSRMWFGRG